MSWIHLAPGIFCNDGIAPLPLYVTGCALLSSDVLEGPRVYRRGSSGLKPFTVDSWHAGFSRGLFQLWMRAENKLHCFLASFPCH